MIIAGNGTEWGLLNHQRFPDSSRVSRRMNPIGVYHCYPPSSGRPDQQFRHRASSNSLYRRERCFLLAPGLFGSLAAVPVTPGGSWAQSTIILRFRPRNALRQRERFNIGGSLSDGQCELECKSQFAGESRASRSYVHFRIVRARRTISPQHDGCIRSSGHFDCREGDEWGWWMRHLSPSKHLELIDRMGLLSDGVAEVEQWHSQLDDLHNRRYSRRRLRSEPHL